jgi:hypothetical protein
MDYYCNEKNEENSPSPCEWEKCHQSAQKKNSANKLGGMEVVLLVEGASACGQCERRSTAIIRHAETSLDMLDCATITDSIGASRAGGACYQEVLSAIRV